MATMAEALARWDLDVAAVREQVYRAANPRERERWHALWLLARGWTAVAVAEALDRDQHTVGVWLEAFVRGGPPAVTFARPAVPPALTAGQRAALDGVLDGSPRAVGVGLANWTWQAVRTYLAEQCDVHLGKSSCLRYLHRLEARPTSLVRLAAWRIIRVSEQGNGRMLGKRPQPGLFEADRLYLEYVGRNTFDAFLASQRGELFSDADFASLYCQDSGRPSVPPSPLATALVLQTDDGVSDEEAVRRAAFDLQWKVALGIEVDARPFAKSTLQEFRAQLVVHEEQRKLFQASLELAKRRGKLERHRKLRVALDTTPILGRGAVKDTYNLLADGIVAVLRVLAGQAGVRRGDGAGFTAWATAAGYERYVAAVSVKGGAAIDWDDSAARERFLAEIVADADRLLEQARVARGTLAVDGPEDKALVDAAGLRSRVLCQDIERKETGPVIRQGTEPDRLISVHDPEMRHGRKSARKRFDGHKAAVAVDTDEQLITAVAVLAGNAPDATDALKLVEQTEQATGARVAETSGDCAYGDGQTRQAFADAGRTLHAKVPVLTNGGRFPKTDFAIDLAAGSCTCPAKQTTRELRGPPGGAQTCVFAEATCADCPLRAQCVGGTGGRTVALHPQEALLQEARAFQASPEFADVRRRRQTVEHRQARLVQLGLRQARYFGYAKTLFPLAMAATVANLTLLAADAARTAPAAVIAALSALLAILITRIFALTSHWIAPHPLGRRLRRHVLGPSYPRVQSAQTAGLRPAF